LKEALHEEHEKLDRLERAAEEWLKKAEAWRILEMDLNVKITRFEEMKVLYA